MANDQTEYYTDDLKKLKERVSKCDIDTLDSIEFFLGEANAYTAGITADIEKEVRDEIKIFKKYCSCTKRYR